MTAGVGVAASGAFAEFVVAHGAAGGLGVALTQQAKLRGAQVIAVVSSPEKARIAREVGADHVISPVDFLGEVRSITGGRGVDMVLDPVGGDRFIDSLRSLTSRGRLLVLGFTGGSIPTVRVNRLLLTNTTVMGVAWEGLMPESSVSLAAQWERLTPHLAGGLLAPMVSDVVTIDQAAEAIAAPDERRAVGKTVIAIRPV